MSGFGYDQYKKLRKNDAPGMIEENNDQFERFFSDRERDEIKPALDSGDNAIIKYEYDPEQLMQHFEDRNKEAAEFDKRTEYFFKESRVGETKATRYSTLAQENNQTLNNYSRSYSYHCASKRKSYATKASGYFTEMKTKMKRYSEDEKLLTSVQKYARQEEIMSYRIKGMHAAAVVKAQSSKHGDFLSYKGKLSCYMILKDQLEHFIENETNVNLKRELESKRKTLNKNIKSAYEGVKKYAPKAVDVWREKQHMDSAYYKGKQIMYKKQAGFANMEKTKLLADLEKIQEYNNENEWPSHIVFRDQFGAVLSKAENNYDTWNGQYSNAQGQELEDKDMEAVKRFENLHVPNPKELANISEYIRGNLRDYYDLCKRALPYYTKGNLPDNVEKYINKNSALLAKIEYVKAVDQYIDFALRNQFEIRYDNSDGIGKTKRWGKFTLENESKYEFYRDPKTKEWKRDEAFGWRQEDATYKALQRAFEIYQNGLTSISGGKIINAQNNASHKINLNTLNNINLINIGDKVSEEGTTDNIMANNSSISEIRIDKDSDISEDILDQSSNLINIEEEKNENIINVNKPVFIEKEKFEENIKIFENKKEENLNKINIIEEEDKKEEKKKIDQNKINIFEPKKISKEKEEKNLNKINIIEDEEEEENLNKINIIKEDKKEKEKDIVDPKIIADLHKFDALTVEQERDKAEEITGRKGITVKDIGLVRAFRDASKFLYDKELNDAYKITKEKFGDKLKENGTIDRTAGAMLRVVHYDKDGKFASEKDRENQEWNKDWLEAVNMQDFDIQKEMIEEELSQCFDEFKLPEPANLEKWLNNTVLKKPQKFVDIFNKCLYIDNMKKTNTVFKKYIEERPIFEKKVELFGNLLNYLQSYLRLKTGFAPDTFGSDMSDGGFIKKEKVKEQDLRADKELVDTAAMFYEGNLQDFRALEERTKKFKFKKLSFETEKETTKKKAELEKRNTKFANKNGYELLKAQDNAFAVYHDSNIKNKLDIAVKKGVIKKGAGGASTDISRIPGSLFRMVHYDKKMRPVSEKDIINAEWNDKVATAFANDDTKAIDEIIKEEIPNIFKGFSLPKIPENAGPKWLDRWIKIHVLPDPEKWFDLTRRCLALSNLVKANETARDIVQNNKELNTLTNLFPILQNMVSIFLRYQYRFDADKTGDKRVLETSKDEAKLDQKILLQLEGTISVYKDMFKDAEKETPKNQYFSDKNLDEEEFEYYNNKDVTFTKESYKRYKQGVLFTRMNINPEILTVYEKAKDNFTGQNGGHSFDRDVRILMKDVHYDDELNPISEEDKKNHQWNLEFLKDWEKNDMDAIQDKTHQQLELFFENITKFPEPTAAELEAMEQMNEEGFKDYIKKVEKWQDEIFSDEKKAFKYMRDSHDGLSFDCIKNTLPSVKEYIKANPKFDHYSNALFSLTDALGIISTRKRHVDNYGKNMIENDQAVNLDRKLKKDTSHLQYFAGFAMYYKQYIECKDNRTVPFKKMK